MAAAVSAPRNVGGTLVRRPLSFETHFTQVPNAYLRDDRLSFKARGVLGYLMSHANGHEISLKAIAEAATEGLAAIRTAVVELEHFGYLKRENTRGNRGTYGTVWELTEPSLPLFEVGSSTAFDNRTRPVDNSSTAFDNRTNTACSNRTHKEHQLRTLKDRYQGNQQSARRSQSDASGDSSSPASASTALPLYTTPCPESGHGHKVITTDRRCVLCGQLTELAERKATA